MKNNEKCFYCNIKDNTEFNKWVKEEKRLQKLRIELSKNNHPVFAQANRMYEQFINLQSLTNI
jgi:hypothetical protein